VPSPNGKEIAIVSRGEILLPMPMVEVPKNHQHTRARGHVQWSPDNKTLIYASGVVKVGIFIP
jgi:hypothetical protein